VLLNGGAVALGATVAASCIQVEYSLFAFQCDPRSPKNCPTTHFCCSDDPATQNGLLPEYGRDVSDADSDTPIFSSNNNSLSARGMCVDPEALVGVNTDWLIPVEGANGNGDIGQFPCPIPCNPTWTNSQISDVCGADLTCCQTVELGPKDCVYDEITEEYRPVNASDIGEMDVTPETRWSPSAHDTHQDPNGTNCMRFADGNMDAYADCIAQLTVANERGFCLRSCDTMLPPDYVDPCEAMNQG